MARVKTGVVRRRRHKKVLKLARGFFSARHKHFRKAKEQLERSLVYAYRDRRQKKRDFRRLWIVRINAACRLNDISYSRFINGLNKAKIELDRKILADLAMNDAKAFAALAKQAKDALKADGVEFPIHLDIPVDQTATSKVQRVQSLKQSIEKTLGKDNVVIDVHQLSKDEVTNITLFAPSAAEEDWDISDNVGWTPDYQDPSTYLDIIKPGGENTKTFLGFDGTDNAAAKQVGLDEYTKLVDEAGAEKQDLNKRYEKYAAAQAWLTDSALLIPVTSRTGRPTLTKVVPFSAPFAWSGAKAREAASYKYMKLQDEPVTTKDYNSAQEKWNKERAESNKKAQEELADHVK